MGLFNKLFGQSDNSASADGQTPKTDLARCQSEQQLVERYGGIAIDKQFDFADLIGDNNWNVDMKQGSISFGENLTFPMQVLGTISHASQSWLWAWANTQSGLSESVMQQ